MFSLPPCLHCKCLRLRRFAHRHIASNLKARPFIACVSVQPPCQHPFSLADRPLPLPEERALLEAAAAGLTAAPVAEALASAQRSGALQTYARHVNGLYVVLPQRAFTGLVHRDSKHLDIGSLYVLRQVNFQPMVRVPSKWELTCIARSMHARTKACRK